MTRKEHETHIRYDYYSQTADFYTTRKGEVSKLKDRLEPIWNDLEVRENEDSWLIRDIPFEHVTTYLATFAHSRNQVEKKIQNS